MYFAVAHSSSSKGFEAALALMAVRRETMAGLATKVFVA